MGAPLVIPTLHLNGTGIAVLKGDLIAVLDALRVAYNAMIAAAPNARDYYPQGEWAFPIAQRAHEARCIKMREMLKDYTAQLDALQDAIDAMGA